MDRQMTLRDHLGPRTDATAALHDELDKLLAAPAAVLKALNIGHAYVDDWMRDNGGREECDIGIRVDIETIEDAIRALATPDSTAALNRVIRAHVQKALEDLRFAGRTLQAWTLHDVKANPDGAITAIQSIAKRIEAITADDVLREMGGRGNG
jgi:hypothetical protein